jgi:BirA family biotin operon repressor/biotin-[acetyl-CoA-carboxylase] ligase
MNNRLAPEAVQDALNTSWIGRTYRYLPEADSTNAQLKKQVAAGPGSSPPDGTVWLTDYQKQGRGRFDRRWEAPPGSSLLFSLLLRPHWPAERLSWLTMIAGLAVTEAVADQTRLAPRLKWPNDGVLRQGGSWHKYCGILLEGDISSEGLLTNAVIGIGINANIRADEMPSTNFPATSLMIAVGQEVSRLDLFTAVLARLESHYEQAQRDRSPHAAWQEQLVFMNTRVAINTSPSAVPLVGTAIGTDAAGRLLLKDDTGITHALVAGDVSLRAY